MLNIQRPIQKEDVDLTVFSIEARNFARGFALDGTFFQVCAFITRDFSVADAEFGFQLPVLPVELKDYQGPTFDLTFAIKLIDFLSVQQKFTDTFRRWDFMACFFVGLNVGVVEKRLSVFNPGKGVADIGFAGANRFNFAALQFDTRFVTLENVKIAQRLAIENRLGGHDRVRNAMKT